MSKPRRGASDLVVLQQKKLLPVGIARPKQWHSRKLCASLQGKRALRGGAGQVSLSALPTDTVWGPGTGRRCHGGSSAAAGPRARPGWPGRAPLTADCHGHGTQGTASTAPQCPGQSSLGRALRAAAGTAAQPQRLAQPSGPSAHPTLSPGQQREAEA